MTFDCEPATLDELTPRAPDHRRGDAAHGSTSTEAEATQRAAADSPGRVESNRRSNQQRRRSTWQGHQSRRARRQPDAATRSCGTLPSGIARLQARRSRSTAARRIRRPANWGDKPNFFDVKVCGNQAESCAQHLAEGRAGRRRRPARLVARGRPRTARSAQAGRDRRRFECSSSTAAATPRQQPQYVPAVGRDADHRRLRAGRATTTSRSRAVSLHGAQPSDHRGQRIETEQGGRKRKRAGPAPRARRSARAATSAARRSTRSTTRTTTSCGGSRPRRARSGRAGSPGACRRHQEQIAVAVKRAREMALLPYVGS